MAAYMDGIDRSHVNYIWRLKTAAKKSGNRSASMMHILNTILSDVLTEDRWGELAERFCAPKENADARTQASSPQPGPALGAAGR